MAVNRRKTLPPVSPKVATELRPLVIAIKEIMEVGEGVRGDPLDRKLTLRDVLDSGIGKLKRGQSAANPGSLEPGTSVPDLSTPPQPQGFEAVGAFDGEIFLTWEPPTRQYNNHAFTNIYRAEEDNFANATLAGQEPGMFFVDNVRADAAPKPYYYWISFTSTSDIEGPLNDTAGTQAQAVSSPDYIIDKIQGLISESELANELLTPIQAIPSIQTTLTDHNSRIDTIQTAVNEVLNLPEFDSSEDYAEGDNVKYNGYAWRALQAMTAPSPTPVEGAYWTQIGAYQTYDQLLSANSVAIDDLDIRITSSEGAITSYGTDITALQNSVTDAENDISGNSLAINTLDSRVTATEGDISANSSDITLLQNGLTTADGEITANSNALNLLDSRVQAAEGTISSHASDITQLQTDVQNLDVDGNAAALQALDTRVTANEDSITSISSDVTTLSASVGDNTSALQTKAEVSAVQDLEDDVTVLSAQYTIKLDVNDRVSGIGFSNDGTGSAMVVASDAVYFIDPGQSVTPFDPNINYASMTAARDTQLVFGYAEVEGQRRFVINAPAYIPELYVETGMFKDQVVTRAKIADLAVNGAKIDVADVWELNINDRIGSDNYSPGDSGFRITRSGSAEFNDVIVRGHVEMETGFISDSVQIGGVWRPSGEILLDSESRQIIPYSFNGQGELQPGIIEVDFTSGYAGAAYVVIRTAVSFSDFELSIGPIGGPYTDYTQAMIDSEVEDSGIYTVRILYDRLTAGTHRIILKNYTLAGIPIYYANFNADFDERYIIEQSVNTSGLVRNWERPGSTFIDGNKIFTGDAYVDTLQIRGDAVVVPTGALRTTRVTAASGSWENYLTFTFNWDPRAKMSGQTVPCYVIALFGSNASSEAGRRLLINGVEYKALGAIAWDEIIPERIERLVDLPSGNLAVQVQIRREYEAPAYLDFAQVIIIGAKR